MQDDLGLAKDLLALSAELGGSAERPPTLRIRMTSAPAFGEPEIEVAPAGPGRRVIDMRRASTHRRIQVQAEGLPSKPQGKPSDHEPPADPVVAPERPAEPRPAAQAPRADFWDRVRFDV